MTRRRVLAIIAVGILCLWLIAILRAELRCSVTKANFDLIHEGMTRDQVESILGPDRGEPAVGTIIIPIDAGLKVDCWRGDDGAAYVAFDDNLRVVKKGWSEAFERPFHKEIYRRLKRALGFGTGVNYRDSGNRGHSVLCHLASTG
jgi:hypothetical protein